MSDYSHRKSSQTVQFVDAQGNAVSNENVEIKLVNHQFLFGSGAFDFLPATAKEDFGDINFYQDNVNPEQKSFMDTLKKMFKK